MPQPPSVPYRSALQNTARPNGRVRRKYPLPPDSPVQFAAYAFDQDFEMRLDGNFPPAQKNTPAAAAAFGSVAGTALRDSNAILTSLTPPQLSGAGLGKFTGTFNLVPASWDEFSSQTVTFPGIRDFYYVNTSARDPKPLTVNVRIHYDYFVIDPGNLATGVLDSGGNAIQRVVSKGAITSIFRTPWKWLYGGSVLGISEVTALVQAGGIAGQYYETVPNTGTYQAWIAVAAAFIAAQAAGGTQGWDATHPPVWNGLINPANTIGQYCFEDSRLVDYAGNIVARQSFYVMPQ